MDLEAWEGSLTAASVCLQDVDHHAAGCGAEELHGGGRCLWLLAAALDPPPRQPQPVQVLQLEPLIAALQRIPQVYQSTSALEPTSLSIEERSARSICPLIFCPAWNFLGIKIAWHDGNSRRGCGIAPRLSVSM